MRQQKWFAALALAAILLAACAQPDLVGKDGRIPGEGGSFARAAKQARFLALGDFGNGNPEQQLVADAMCNHLTEEAFEHVVTTGDNVYASGEPSNFTKAFVKPYACLHQAGVRFHSVLGNHDIRTNAGASEVGQPIFGFMGPYYTWSLGPVTFIMLDSQGLDIELENAAPGAEQYDWMLEEIADARKDPWTVVVFHDPVHSTGKQHASKPGFGLDLGVPFAENGVDLVLNGHDHNYQYAELNGVSYVVTGGGGADIYPCSEPFEPP
ncbi:MAG TPA: metallophosphoesterase, partial [Actinomycetota bacterium]|nr:metallophosphoesterase [Actinomycetota bacterium]